MTAMNYTTHRQRRIEQLLRDEFAFEGYHVAETEGIWFGYVPSSLQGDLSIGINLTKLAAQIEKALS